MIRLIFRHFKQYSGSFQADFQAVFRLIFMQFSGGIQAVSRQFSSSSFVRSCYVKIDMMVLETMKKRAFQTTNYIQP